MKAFHSNWTRPFLAKHKGPYYIEDFEILTTIISALKWQEINGDIEMITDSVGAAYYRQLGMERVWNLGIDDTLEQKMDPQISPTTFWAAGKLYALKKQSAPCVMIDTDFIVWKPLKECIQGHDVAVIHREGLDPFVYPGKEQLKIGERYTYPEEIDWSVEACNTALACFNDESLKTYYLEEAFRFMVHITDEDPLVYMVFAEQRLLAICAAAMNKEILSLASLEELFHSKQQSYTHIWGHKQYLRQQPKARAQFCRRCIQRIADDFPSYMPIVENIECLKIYLK